MSRSLSIAVAPYDRTLPLMAGLVPIQNVTPTYVTAPLEEIFARAFDEQAFDVTELSFSNYLYLTATTGCPYVGLPVFPSRAFRHSAIYIRTDRGIRGPRDLAGRLVGVREFSMTAALVARGMLADDFGLSASEVRWRYGKADKDDSQPIIRVRPRDTELEPLTGADSLSDALAEGTIEAIVAYKPPKAFLEGAPNIRRLFVDYPAVEADYARRTGIFPIMHLIGVRRDLVEREPDLCLRICDAFETARRYAIARTSETQAPFTSLPWAPAEAARAESILGQDYWRYGVAANKPAIEALCRYSFEQGIAPRLLTPEELFAPSTLAWK